MEAGENDAIIENKVERRDLERSLASLNFLKCCTQCSAEFLPFL